MYVVWRKRQGRRGVTLYCSVQQSHRAGGTTWTMHNWFLGTVREDGADREYFWNQLKANLDQHDISPAEKAKIEAKIAQKIPPI
jgi:hypothetical protein